MTDNFNKYKKIIDYFRGEVSNKDFETKFALKSANIPKSDRFLLKMELKRLASPCKRLVDLRGLVDGECEVFVYEKNTHFLDDIAIKVFHENVTFYGAYTVGVYEALTNTENNFRVRYQKEKLGVKSVQTKQESVNKVSEKTQYPANFFKFGEYYDRHEERMNFSTSLLITRKRNKIKCQSSDLSTNGCKFRVANTANIQLGDIISIHFLGLEKEFSFGSDDIFNYEIKNIQLVGSLQLVGVESLDNGDKIYDVFKRFLSDFIQDNKRRYKINLDNTIAALLSRSYEQYVLPKSNELPVFLSGEGKHLLPRYALTCVNNHQIFEYWQDENKHSTLHFLMTPNRLERLKKLVTLGEPLVVYSFIHQNQGKYYFYSADEQELKSDLMTEFLSFSANKPSFAITTLTLSSIDRTKVNSFYTLSNSLTNKDQYLNLPVSEENIDKIDELSYIVVVNDITSEDSKLIYEALFSDKVNVDNIKTFGHKRIKVPFNVEEIGINYQNHRQESRFKFNTRVEVTYDNVVLDAESLDFSTSGLKLEFSEPVTLNKGDIVYLSFPKLQKITSLFDLKFLPYTLVGINKKKTIINIRVQVDKHKHIGKSFFKALIEKNINKLTPDEYASMVQGLVQPLRNIYSSSSSIPHLIIQTSGSRYKFEALGCGKEYGQIMRLMREFSDKEECYNLYPVLNNLSLTNSLMLNLKKARASDRSITETLYLAISPGAEKIENRVTSKVASELTTVKLQNTFMKSAQKTGYFLCLQLKLSRTNAPDMDYITPELNYISAYAIHRGKQIEQELWSVAGVVQVLDITKETIMRIKLSAKKNARS